MIGPLDITSLERTWQEYLDDRCNNASRLRWMGRRMGRVLQEIRILRTQVEGLQATLEEERQTRFAVA